MNQPHFQTSGSAVYREVGEELVVIQVDTGRFYYFSRATKTFLDFFKNPGSLDRFLESSGLADETEKSYLSKFAETLRERRILVSVAGTSEEPHAQTHPSYSRPELLRAGEKTLDDIASEITVTPFV